ncbi:hypothetical protein ACFQV2_14415 [Actinokineospora soli]|uniref:4-oxalocrotonate tautomerase n=1 Tax=Actinokineospora soli TaxID=1048753 RepID=A0ABW2TP05_9PSEU
MHEVAQDRSRVVVHLNAPHGDAEEVQRELVGAIAALAHGAAAHTDDVRAGEQDGWAG